MGQLVRALAAQRKASVLFRTMKKIRVTCNPFDSASVTAREFLRRVRTKEVRTANKDLQVEFNSIETYGAANIELDFADGHKQNIDCSSAAIVDILDEVERLARWRSQPGGDPFGGLRDEREAHLKEVEKQVPNASASC